MIFNEIAALLDGLGFDPYLGFYHSPDYGRGITGRRLGGRIPRAGGGPLHFEFDQQPAYFAEADFHSNPRGEGIYFNREAMKRYFAEYESYLNREFN